MLYQQPVNNNLQYTLNTQLAQGGPSMVLSASVQGVIQAPGVCVVDRVDSAGNKTASVREYISFTGVSGNTLTGLSKGLAGSTDQVHNVGAIVEFIPDVTWANSIYSAITQEHSVNGQHTSLASVSNLNTLALNVPSVASIRQAEFIKLDVASTASISFLNVGVNLNVSAASITGNLFIRPTWFMGGTLSGASTSLGSPIAMPQAGNLLYAYVTSRIGASQASLSFDILKNGQSIIASSNVLTIPINGTFASTSSFASLSFNSGDSFTVGPSNVSSFLQDATLVLVAR